MYSLENIWNTIYKPNNAQDATIGNIAASLLVIVSDFYEEKYIFLDKYEQSK